MCVLGFCKSASGNRSADTHPVEFAVLRAQTGFNIPQALTVGQFHDAELVKADEALDTEVPLITIHTTMESFQRHKIHDLREDQLTRAHNTSRMTHWENAR